MRWVILSERSADAPRPQKELMVRFIFLAYVSRFQDEKKFGNNVFFKC